VVLLVVVVNRKQKVKQTLAGVGYSYEGKNQVKEAKRKNKNSYFFL
jgi:hypothetical protein